MPIQRIHYSISRQKGAFLIISMILLFVVSIVAIALVATSINIGRTNQYFSKYIQSEIRAISMGNFAYRLLDTYQAGKFPGPSSCTDELTCNQMRLDFPYASTPTPLLPYISGSSGAESRIGSSRDSSWWNTYSYQPDLFLSSLSVNYLIVSILGEQTSSPYNTTYRVSGHSVDAAGQQKYGETYEMYYVWTGFPPDPGDGTCGGGCYYGQCCSAGGGYCSDGTAYDACFDSNATYTPPGWTCEEYFVTGLGYDPTICNFAIAPPT